MPHIETLIHDLLAMKDDISEAKHHADLARLTISSHEELCTARYKSLDERLDAVPAIFLELGKIKQIVYIGVGIWIGMPVVAGFLFGLYRLVKEIGHG